MCSLRLRRLAWSTMLKVSVREAMPRVRGTRVVLASHRRDFPTSVGRGEGCPVDLWSLAVCAARHMGARGAVAPHHSRELTPMVRESVDVESLMKGVVPMHTCTSIETVREYTHHHSREKLFT
jgi:hypothetical protein